MRTPGNDFELAAGFLYDEAIVRSRDEIAKIDVLPRSGDRSGSALQHRQRRAARRRRAISRASSGTSRRAAPAASAAGRSSTALRDLGVTAFDDDVRVPAEPPLRAAAADARGVSGSSPRPAVCTPRRSSTNAATSSRCARTSAATTPSTSSSVGACSTAHLPFARSMLMVSGRASYEILQKSAMARIPIVCSVSAPSSLAVRALARVQRHARRIFARRARERLRRTASESSKDARLRGTRATAR